MIINKNIMAFQKGHKITEEMRRKMSLAKLGKPTWNKDKKTGKLSEGLSHPFIQGPQETDHYVSGQRRPT